MILLVTSGVSVCLTRKGNDYPFSREPTIPSRCSRFPPGAKRASFAAMTSANDSKVWNHHFKTAPGTPPGFTVRGTVPGNPEGVEAMLERWEAGTSEPPHSHPGDDMTVVV